MRDKGTHQGSVLLPMLFNIALIRLPRRLENIPRLHHSLYADDILLWVTGGIDEDFQADPAGQQARYRLTNCTAGLEPVNRPAYQLTNDLAAKLVNHQSVSQTTRIHGACEA
ncbi:hypothetical protein HPB49_015433 [Dermacentor silvarum]|uniref:Uncharacterized protein n=1 Tax=Dermacentor silvarum TaxID=543639 RepID=A0ACB8CXT5_DERSI|nr:hypothetical protein HPB49_015433 [Dermacentor silvarum]